MRPGPAGGNFTAHPDEWLGRLLGRPALRLDRADTGDAGWIGRLDHEDLLVTAKLPAQDVAAVGALESIGFRVIDMALTFEASAIEPRADQRVRVAKPGDRDAVATLAGRSFRFSRFHLDPEIPRALADRVKARWAANFFMGGRGDAMVVAEQDSAVVGFLQLLRGPSGGVTIDLIAVAPEASRQGLARAMIGLAAQGVGGARPKGWRVGTQAANIASVRLYESLGFRLSQAQFVLHHHGRGGPYPEAME
jgi:ribosomal protein S18 acetylase RimI-like enzyme